MSIYHVSGSFGYSSSRASSFEAAEQMTLFASRNSVRSPLENDGSDFVQSQDRETLEETFSVEGHQRHLNEPVELIDFSQDSSTTSRLESEYAAFAVELIQPFNSSQSWNRSDDFLDTKNSAIGKVNSVPPFMPRKGVATAATAIEGVVKSNAHSSVEFAPPPFAPQRANAHRPMSSGKNERSGFARSWKCNLCNLDFETQQKLNSHFLSPAHRGKRGGVNKLEAGTYLGRSLIKREAPPVSRALNESEKFNPNTIPVGATGSGARVMRESRLVQLKSPVEQPQEEHQTPFARTRRIVESYELKRSAVPLDVYPERLTSLIQSPPPFKRPPPPIRVTCARPISPQLPFKGVETEPTPAPPPFPATGRRHSVMSTVNSAPFAPPPFAKQRVIPVAPPPFRRQLTRSPPAPIRTNSFHFAAVGAHFTGF